MTVSSRLPRGGLGPEGYSFRMVRAFQARSSGRPLRKTETGKVLGFFVPSAVGRRAALKNVFPRKLFANLQAPVVKEAEASTALNRRFAATRPWRPLPVNLRQRSRWLRFTRWDLELLERQESLSSYGK